jgi:hypothetical protein
MTATRQYQPLLAINRLVVHRGGKPVYDQRFHFGVNIIRGANGSGKSTILDFIFHVLGGEVLGANTREWKDFASLCDSVSAEVTLNDAIVTIRREISEDKQRPLHIYFDSMDAAQTRSLDNWQSFPYSRSAAKESFSQILFRALKLPEATTEDGTNITMHQLLRLLYVDQMTPVQRIFRLENFDPPILKQAVGDFLCGVGQFNLYEKQVALRAAEKSFAAVSSDLKNIRSLAADIDTPLKIASLQAEIQTLSDERLRHYQVLGDASRSDLDTQVGETADRERERRRTFNEIGSLREKIQSLELEIRTLTFEKEDSTLFLNHLRETLRAVEEATLTYEQLGGVHFKYCPACFTLTGTGSADHHCHLCKKELDESERGSRSLAIKIDLEIQLKESAQLQEEREQTLRTTSQILRAARRELSTKSAAYDALARAPISSRDARIGQLNQRIGFIDSRIEILNERSELASKLDGMAEEKARLNTVVSRLKDEIAAILATQDKRKRTAYTHVSNNVLNYLHADTGDQEEFVKAERLSFSFADDVMFVDGKSNFAASSLVILKNSFHLGLIASSLSDAEFLLPRFMLFDNIEDKGMVPARSWNFQNLICRISEATSTKHQIIFTTSMMDPKLEGSRYLVGPLYSKENRTLALR